MHKFGIKNALFGYFVFELGNNIVMFEINPPRICRIANFHEKINAPKFGTKNVLFRYTWA